LACTASSSKRGGLGLHRFVVVTQPFAEQVDHPRVGALGERRHRLGAHDGHRVARSLGEQAEVVFVERLGELLDRQRALLGAGALEIGDPLIAPGGAAGGEQHRQREEPATTHHGALISAVPRGAPFLTSACHAAWAEQQLSGLSSWRWPPHPTLRGAITHTRHLFNTSNHLH
jgi:hypothetical protein